MAQTVNTSLHPHASPLRTPEPPVPVPVPVGVAQSRRSMEEEDVRDLGTHCDPTHFNDSSVLADAVEDNPLSATITLSQSPSIRTLCDLFQQIVGRDPFSESNKVLIEKSCTLTGNLIDSTYLQPPTRVVNLSSRQLTVAEQTLLEKGLNFCPTPGEPKMGDLVNDLDYFHDNLRWQYHFFDNPRPAEPFDRLVMTSTVLKKSSRPSPPPAHRNLEAFIFLNDRELQRQRLMEPHAKNVSVEEKEALASLSRDSHITIKQADKGGAVVILDTQDYIAEGRRQLSDPRFYHTSDHDLTPEFSDRIEKYLTSLFTRHIISKAVY